MDIGNTGNVGKIASAAHDLGRKADDSDTLDHAVRVGLIAYGVVHLLIGWIAIQLAFGDREGTASGSGALSQMAQNPLGGVLMWITAGGFFSLVVWRVIEAAVGHRDEEGATRVRKRLGSLFKAVLYGSLGVTALRIAVGGGSDGGGTDTVTAKLMQMPGGQLLVAAVGVAVLGYAGRLVWRGVSGSFADRLQSKGRAGNTGRAFIALGRAGYGSKGLALTVVAGLFLWAAWSHDPKKSGGLDQALLQVLQQPFGAPMLIGIGLGFACYGLFCFAWARHLDR